jgi:hypothetical protein
MKRRWISVAVALTAASFMGTGSAAAMQSAGNTHGIIVQIAGTSKLGGDTQDGPVYPGFGLPHGLETSLLAKLNAAIKADEAGNINAECGDLQAFINESNAQSGKKLTEAQANQIIAEATALRELLGC